MKSIFLTSLVDPDQPIEQNGYELLATSDHAVVFSYHDQDYLCMYKQRKNEYTIYIYAGEFDENFIAFSPEKTLYKSFPMFYNSEEEMRQVHANLVASLFYFDIEDIYVLSKVLLGYFPSNNIVNTINLDNVTIN